MRYKEICEHNSGITYSEDIYYRITRKITTQLGVTSDNFLVVISPKTYLSRSGKPSKEVIGCLIVAAIVDNKITLLTGADYRLFKNKGVLRDNFFNDLDNETYDLLAKEFDMSAIPKSDRYAICAMIDKICRDDQQGHDHHNDYEGQDKTMLREEYLSNGAHVQEYRSFVLVRINVANEPRENLVINAYDNYIEITNVTSNKRIMRYTSAWDARLAKAKYTEGNVIITIPTLHVNPTVIRFED